MSPVRSDFSVIHAYAPDETFPAELLETLFGTKDIPMEQSYFF